jgi:hypothetical protein
MAGPATEREDRGFEFASPLRQLVDLGRGRRGETAAAQDPGALQLTQALAQHVGAEVRDAGAEVGEPLRTQKQLPDD